ncbi:hypothetical protein L2E82_12684 [Cichorium intybus]|uniref:Uncharacterized protein n=1 Tax=Cichorium intybus TaxID=13427 RepID=A0ACB9GHE1_CICIN|nr:hypothetical protein L2E82_12684 [Cichorium intybus]
MEKKTYLPILGLNSLKFFSGFMADIILASLLVSRLVATIHIRPPSRMLLCLMERHVHGFARAKIRP